VRLGTAAIVAFGCAALVPSAALSYSAIPANKPATPAAASTPAVPVVAEQVKSSDVPIYLGGIGSVQAYNTVTVHSQITGPITQIAFTEGQLVHTGDLLAQIDPRPYQAQVDQAIANKARDQAQLANAQQILERNLPLLPKGFVAQQTVETEKDQVAQAAATVQADEAQIESARVQLSYTRLSSPIDGVTGIRGIDIGNIIHPTDPNGLVVVTQLQPISVIFTLPETDLPRIQEAMAKGTLTVLADSQDNKILLDKGTLTVLDNQIVQTSGTYFAGIKRAS
jgi:multidrug efflux system membrane fusion protein